MVLDPHKHIHEDLVACISGSRRVPTNRFAIDSILPPYTLVLPNFLSLKRLVRLRLARALIPWFLVCRLHM